MEEGFLQLKTKKSSFSFFPKYGLQWYSLKFKSENKSKDLELIYGWNIGKEIFSFGNFWMFPWVNRLVNPPWEENRISYDANGIPLHGTLHSQAWDCKIESPDSAFCTTKWKGRFQNISKKKTIECSVAFYIQWELEESTWKARGWMESLSKEEFPISFGWHPYFLLPEKSSPTLEIPQADELKLNPNTLLPEPDGNGKIQRKSTCQEHNLKLENLSLDNLYHQKNEFLVRLKFYQLGYGFEFRSKKLEKNNYLDFPYIQVYKTLDGQFVAIEPMTGPGNFLSYPNENSLILHPQEKKFFFFQICFFEIP